MSARYAPLPNPQSDMNSNTEMEAAFDDSDDEDQPLAAQETRPLNPQPSHPSTPGPGPGPATYDFENFDYASFPPPGSPPGPSTRAFSNDWGNSNGLIPSTSNIDASSYGPRSTWWRRKAASVLPASYVRRWGLDYEHPQGVVGGGTNNDGVFANVTAKPSRPMQIREGDEIFVVPEDAQKEVPPSYSSAQADSVPPYWETTVHAPSSPGAFGEMIIDALPTGSLFSFLWNMLVSISFQFVGFLLTYLLHTTHAARFGSRAGLGVTLIQYGFALRGASSGSGSGSGGGDDANADSWGGWSFRGAQGQGAGDVADPKPTFDTLAEAEEYYRNRNVTMVDGVPTSTSTGMVDPGTQMAMDQMTMVSDATTDWISFFLMTIGWFILLTSVLGFWRVKRWESNIIASQRENAGPGTAADAQQQSQAIASSLQRVFGLPRRQDISEMLRTGLGFSSRRRDGGEDSSSSSNARGGFDLGIEIDEEDARRGHEEEEVDEAREREILEREREEMLQMYAHDPERQRQLVQSFRDDDQLLANMRAAGML
ncbi:uncharacterized protein STEHIDRAFT_120588 [Stereum hirsutum FP-91666 SS1]|uniref:uncharacterized protein n=1 Tax=Stereum hirsutum (strain FP-91666) TaxID=721885 RepID=UPI000440EBA5|nr:uncharacterized protein STEHIDRAFT_120588 [Stereum hirsutum FP-91666 SS1]EIM88412.1 hypothetical protein STEHIDRAFT_120588 [Stereum hirsutum FP-91666 SS1]